MPRKILDRVTLTGADDSVMPEDLLAIAKEYPFVEWGILMSRSSGGDRRFPSKGWLERLQNLVTGAEGPYCFSAHVCGAWVRDICMGDWSVVKELKGLWAPYSRMQLNFHAQRHNVDEKAFLDALMNLTVPIRQYIFQLDGMNDHLLKLALDRKVPAVGLFDLSHGAGVLPKKWPDATGAYLGYAGGLSPENVAQQLAEIEKVCGEGPVWIDAETKVRSDFDARFDLKKVRTFIEAALPWVREECLSTV